jgi:predicted P-loop ATPase
MIDRDGLERVRDRLWAEAVHRFEAGATWWLETPELEALAAAEQAARFIVDPWEAPVAEWLGDRIDVSVQQVLRHALRLRPEDQTQQHQNRVARILTNLGFVQFRPRTPKGRPRRYHRDPPPMKKQELKPGPVGPPQPRKADHNDRD